MLAQNQLVDLYRSHRDDQVLSVYLDTDQRDFAERSKWRVALKNRLSEERAKASDKESFDEAYAQLRAWLEPDGNGFLAGKGWVGFATPQTCIYAEALPVPMPDLVRWEPGLRVAPYARALKQARPVVVVLIDSRHAAIHRYEMGALTDGEELHADTDIGDLTDINIAKRGVDHSGVRGKTATDAAQRLHEVERDRLVLRVAEEVRAEAGRAGIVVLGGSERVAEALHKQISGLGEHRLVVAHGLTFDMSPAELRRAVEGIASDVSADDQCRVLEQAIDLAKSQGDACLGQKDTERALVEKRVATLLVSDTLRRERPDRADHLEGAAFEQGAAVVEVSRDAGERLDREGEGVGALLRYRVRAEP